MIVRIAPIWKEIYWPFTQICIWLWMIGGRLLKPLTLQQTDWRKLISLYKGSKWERLMGSIKMTILWWSWDYFNILSLYLFRGFPQWKCLISHLIRNYQKTVSLSYRISHGDPNLSSRISRRPWMVFVRAKRTRSGHFKAIWNLKIAIIEP